MEIIFFILVIILVIISIWEYYSGKVLDIAFIGILARREDVKKRFIGLLLIQLLIWILFLAFVILLLKALFVTGPGGLRRIRTYSVIIIVLAVFPFAMIRKRYISWVEKTIMSNNKK